MKVDKNSEVYRSPAGFRDRYGADWDFDYNSRDIARKVAYLSCFEPLITTPIGFLSTFEKERILNKDRIYPLTDLSGRQLVLSPDSTASVLRWLCEYGKSSNYTRLMFTSPVFRYRRNKYKYTNHLGYAIANEKSDSSSTYNQALITIVDAMFQFFSKFDNSIKIKVTDFSIWHRLLAMEFNHDGDRKDILYQLRFKDVNSQKSYIESTIRNSSLKNLILSLLNEKNVEIENIIQQTGKNLFEPILDFKSDLKKIYGIEASFDLSNFHGSEVQSGIAFQFYSGEGLMLGDGGCYSDYAKKFNSNIRSFFSAATSVEYLGEIYGNKLSQSDLKVCIVYMNNQAKLARKVCDEFRKIKIPALITKANKKILNNINSVKQNNCWYTILGAVEEENNMIVLKNTTNDIDFSVSINDIKSLSSIYFENLMPSES